MSGIQFGVMTLFRNIFHGLTQVFAELLVQFRKEADLLRYEGGRAVRHF